MNQATESKAGDGLVHGRIVVWLARAGIAVVAAGLYFALFWGLPLAAFSSPLAVSRPEAMGCTFAEFVIGFHLMVACVVWGSWGMADRNIHRYLGNGMPPESIRGYLFSVDGEQEDLFKVNIVESESDDTEQSQKLMKKRIELNFAHNPVVDGDYLIGMLVFKDCIHPIKSVSGVFINDIGVPESEYKVYTGNQNNADEMLMKNVPGWTEQHIAKDIPYISLKVKYDRKYYIDSTTLNISADLVT